MSQTAHTWNMAKYLCRLFYSKNRLPFTQEWVSVRGVRSGRSARALTDNSVLTEQEDDCNEVHITQFGNIRRDKDNIPKTHGQFEAKRRIETSNQIGDEEQEEHVRDFSTAQNDAHTNTQSAHQISVKKVKANRLPNIDDDAVIKSKEKKPQVDSSSEPKTAFDAVNDAREKFSQSLSVQTCKLDSKGFRVLMSEVKPVLHQMSKEDILTELRRRVILNTPEVLVIDKPYGMSMHGGGNSNSQSKFALTAYLPLLARMFDAKKLFTVHRLDKSVTGTVCLAKSKEIADVIESLFKARQITKEYVGIVRGIPKNPEGVIDIPIAMGSIEDKERMVLVPRLPPDSTVKLPKFDRVFEAVTEYKIIKSANASAYIRINPKTGFKHQIRVHLGFGLKCPILGDHKYSYLTKMLPQKLPGEMLDALKIRQEKVREVPLHLHSRLLIIPGILQGGKNLIARSNLPGHFRKNLERLKLT